MRCIACNKEISRGHLLSCISCKQNVHYQCLNITSARFKEHGKELKQSWQCMSCTNVTKPPRNDDTPIRINVYRSDDSATSNDDHVEEPLDQREGANTMQQNLSRQEQEASISYGDFEKLLDYKLKLIEKSITNNVRSSIRDEINSAIDKLKTEFTETTDFLAAEQSDIRKDINNTGDKIKHLEAENSKLSMDLAKLEGRLRTAENSSRRCNVEIQMLPEHKSENLIGILKNICDQINYIIPDSEIRSVRRVAKLQPLSDRPRNVLVTLSSERYRDGIISAYKAYNRAHTSNRLNSSHLGQQFDSNSAPLYVVEHLSPESKELHALARKAAKRLSYKHVWVKHSRIYMKRTDDSELILIKDQNCLTKLI